MPAYCLLPKRWSASMSPFENIPAEMQGLSQWVCWKLEQRSNGKAAKVPYFVVHGRKASVTDPNDWGQFEECCAAVVNGHCNGIGFVLTSNDPYACVDLDNCFEQDGSAKPYANEIGMGFKSWTERSQSGKGLHIWVKVKLSGTGRNDQGSCVEIYSKERFIAMTGNVYKDVPIAEGDLNTFAKWCEEKGYLKPKDVFPQGVSEPFPAQPCNDEQLIAFIRGSDVNRKHFDCEDIQDWSNSYHAVLNAACVRSDNEAQIKRVMLHSLLVMTAASHGSETRPERVERYWGVEYPKAALQGAQERAKKAAQADLGASQWQQQAIVPTGVLHGLAGLLHLAETAPDTEFTTECLTPVGEVTLLSANGGIGKTMFCLQWGLSIASGCEFFGHKTQKAPVLFVSAEDSEVVCAKRIRNISQSEKQPNLWFSIQFNQPKFSLWTLEGPLWQSEQRGHTSIETGAKQVFIDNVATVFQADQNNSGFVTSFITRLRNLAEKTECNILLLAHVSADNATKGSAKTYFGSSAWHNAERSRLFMQIIPDNNSGMREHVSVEHEKSNYGRMSETFRIQRDKNTGVLFEFTDYEIAQAINDNDAEFDEMVLNDIAELAHRGENVPVANQGQNTFANFMIAQKGEHYSEKDKMRLKQSVIKIEKNGKITKNSYFTEHNNCAKRFVQKDAPQYYNTKSFINPAQNHLINQYA